MKRVPFVNRRLTSIWISKGLGGDSPYIPVYPSCIFEKGILQLEPGVWFFICWNAPAWLACSRRSDSRVPEKNSQRKKNEGRLEGERGREPHPPPPVLPVYTLTHSPLTGALYYLSAWNRLLPDTISLKAFWTDFTPIVWHFWFVKSPRGVLLRILGRGVLPGSPNPDPISEQKLSFFTPVFRPGL